MGFPYVGDKTFDFSSKKRIFCPKTTQFVPKLAFLSIAGSFGALLVGWLVVVARAVSCKTPIYFIFPSSFLLFPPCQYFLGKCECGKWLYDSVTWMWNRGRLRSTLTVQHGSLSPHCEQILRFQRILFFVASYLLYNNRRLTSDLMKYCQNKKVYKICIIYTSRFPCCVLFDVSWDTGI